MNQVTYLDYVRNIRAHERHNLHYHLLVEFSTYISRRRLSIPGGSRAGDLTCRMTFGIALGATSTWLSLRGIGTFILYIRTDIGQLSICSPENCERIWLLEDMLIP